ncbi:MAG: J domain-containing protein [bacterium]|nr:J domain-containing protein [bacterium]
MSQDLYEILGISRDASEDEVRKAYRKLAMQFHPDRNPDDEQAAKRFKEVSEAYEILSDAEKRKTYDTRGMAGVQDQGFEGFASNEDIFSHFADIFGSRARTRSATRAQPGRDLRFLLSIDFLLAARGGRREIQAPTLTECSDCHGYGTANGSPPMSCDRCQGTGKVDRESRHQGGFFSVHSVCPDCQGSGVMTGPRCKTCNGDGRVNKPRSITFEVPAGTRDGQVLRLKGQGEAGLFGGPAGDLLVEMEVLPDPQFTRDGNNIRSDVKVPVVTALLGGKVDVRTIHGKVALTIPACTSSDQVLRIRGQGIHKRTEKGDHLVRVVIEVPDSLSAEAQSAIREHLGTPVSV